MDLHKTLDVSIVDQKVVISVMTSGGEGRRSTIGPTILDSWDVSYLPTLYEEQKVVHTSLRHNNTERWILLHPEVHKPCLDPGKHWVGKSLSHSIFGSKAQIASICIQSRMPGVKCPTCTTFLVFYVYDKAMAVIQTLSRRLELKQD
jgi:hypothetical protein